MKIFLFLFPLVLFAQSGAERVQSEQIERFGTITGAPTSANPTAGNYDLFNANSVFSKRDSTGAINRLIAKEPGNSVINPDIEQGLTPYVYTAGTVTLNTATPLEGLNSLNFDATALNDFVETPLMTIPRILMGQTCMIKVSVRGGDANLQMQVVNGAGTIVGFKQLAVFTDSTPQFITFQCPTQALITATPALGQLKIKVVQSTATNAALATLDNFYLGQMITNQMVVSGQVEEFRARNSAYNMAASQKIQFQIIDINTISECGTVTNDATNRWTYTGKKDCTINLNTSINTVSTAAGQVSGYNIFAPGLVYSNISGPVQSSAAGQNISITGALSGIVKLGETITILTGSSPNLFPVVGGAAYFSMTATPLPQLATIVSMVNPMSPQWYYYSSATDINGFFTFPSPSLSKNDKTLFDYSGTALTALKPININFNVVLRQGLTNGQNLTGVIGCTILGTPVTIDYYYSSSSVSSAFYGTPSASVILNPGDTCTLNLTRSALALTAHSVNITATHILDPNNDPNIMAVLPSQTQYLENNLTLYVATTGSDSTGDGSAGKPFATPQAALNYLGRYTFAPGVEVLISVAAGQYILTSSIVPQHPQGAQITIQGATVTTPPVAADFCQPGTNPARGFSNPTAAQRETCQNTDLTMLRGKYPTELRFATTNIDGIVVNGANIKIANLLISGNYLASTNPTNAAARGITAGYQTSPTPDQKITGANIFSTGPISVQGFAVQGVILNYGSNMKNNATITSSGNGNSGFYVIGNSSIYNLGIAISWNNLSSGFTAQNNGTVQTNGNSYSNYNGGVGYYVTSSSLISITGTGTAYNNGSHGFNANINSSVVVIGSTTSNQNQGSGFTAERASSISCSNSTVSITNNSGPGIYVESSGNFVSYTNLFNQNNGSHGISSGAGGVVFVYGSPNSIIGNSGYGLNVSNQGVIQFEGTSTVTTNTLGVAAASFASHIRINNLATATGNGGANLVQSYAESFIQMNNLGGVTYSPAYNVIGNQNSMVGN